MWRFERASWLLLAVLVLTALVGLFGSGPRSCDQRAAPDGSVQLTYQRFGRRGAPMTLDVTVASMGAGGDRMATPAGPPVTFSQLFYP